MNSDEARALMHEWTEGASLRAHMESVAACMDAYAERLDPADRDRWIVTGLLHDMDYEKHPTAEEHPFVGVSLLKDLGYPEEMTEAILGHASYTGVARTTLLARALFAVDELAGFITAVAYVRPTGLEGMKPKSVKKKLKDRAFAAAVSRDDVYAGVEELEVNLDEHIARVIAGMLADADRLGFTSSDE